MLLLNWALIPAMLTRWFAARLFFLTDSAKTSVFLFLQKAKKKKKPLMPELIMSVQMILLPRFRPDGLILTLRLQLLT